MDLARRTQLDRLGGHRRATSAGSCALWSDLLARFGGPFLVGEWSIADAFFTPVATRFRTYGVRLSDFGDEGAGWRLRRAAAGNAGVPGVGKGGAG